MWIALALLAVMLLGVVAALRTTARSRLPATLIKQPKPVSYDALRTFARHRTDGHVHSFQVTGVKAEFTKLDDEAQPRLGLFLQLPSRLSDAYASVQSDASTCPDIDAEIAGLLDSEALRQLVDLRRHVAHLSCDRERIDCFLTRTDVQAEDIRHIASELKTLALRWRDVRRDLRKALAKNVMSDRDASVRCTSLSRLFEQADAKSPHRRLAVAHALKDDEPAVVLMAAATAPEVHAALLLSLAEGELVRADVRLRAAKALLASALERGVKTAYGIRLLDAGHGSELARDIIHAFETHLTPGARDALDHRLVQFNHANQAAALRLLWSQPHASARYEAICLELLQAPSMADRRCALELLEVNGTVAAVAPLRAFIEAAGQVALRAKAETVLARIKERVGNQPLGAVSLSAEHAHEGALSETKVS